MNKRQCASCRVVKNKDELIKITKMKNGDIVVNPSSKQVGRSMYVCKDKTCIENLLKKTRIENSLKIKSELNKQELIKEINQYI